MDCKFGCLYDVVNDPTEHHELSAEKPKVLEEMIKKLKDAKSHIWHRTDSKKTDPRCH